MPTGGGRRSSSSSSDSRSLSPYNKRRRGRSADKTRRSPAGNKNRTHSRKSRSPRRRPRSRTPPRKYSPPPQSSGSSRRRSPPRSFGGGGGSSAARGGPPPATRGRVSPPPPAASRRKSSPGSPGPAAAPRGRKRSPSPPPRRRTPSPKRRRSPERRNDRHKTPPPPPPPALPSRDRRSPVRRESRPQPQQVYSSTARRSRSRSPKAHNQDRPSGYRQEPTTSPPYADNRNPSSSNKRHSGAGPADDRGSTRDTHHHSRKPSGDHSSHHHHHGADSRDGRDRRRLTPPTLPPPPITTPASEPPIIGSKDMDYRDKRMGDPRAAKEQNSNTASNNDTYHSSGKSRSSKYDNNDSYDKKPSSTKGGGDSGGGSKKELGVTGVLINTRFTEVDKTKNFKPKDLITIGIERNIIGDEPAIISPAYAAEYVVIPRRREEGERPLSTREEFVTRQEEYVERRVIKVIKSSREDDDEDKDKQNRFDLDGRENFEVRRDRVSLSQRWGDDPKIEQRVSMRHESIKDSFPSSSRHVERRSRSADRGDSYRDRDDRHGDRDERLVQKSSKRDGRQHSPMRDRDERIVSASKSDFRKDEDLRTSKSSKDRSKYEKDPMDLREKLARRRGRKDTADPDTVDARQKIERKRSLEGRRQEDDSGRRRVEARSPDKGELPDFSKRPDKGNYQPWEENPEMIPKGINYYEVSSQDAGVNSRSKSRATPSQILESESISKKQSVIRLKSPSATTTSTGKYYRKSYSPDIQAHSGRIAQVREDVTPPVASSSEKSRLRLIAQRSNSVGKLRSTRGSSSRSRSRSRNRSRSRSSDSRSSSRSPVPQKVRGVVKVTKQQRSDLDEVKRYREVEAASTWQDGKGAKQTQYYEDNLDVRYDEHHDRTRSRSNSMTRVVYSVDENRTPPGYNRTPPGYDRTPPGYDRTPPGYDRTPPGYDRTPPGYNNEDANTWYIDYNHQSNKRPSRSPTPDDDRRQLPYHSSEEDARLMSVYDRDERPRVYRPPAADQDDRPPRQHSKLVADNDEIIARIAKRKREQGRDGGRAAGFQGRGGRYNYKRGRGQSTPRNKAKWSPILSPEDAAHRLESRLGGRREDRPPVQKDGSPPNRDYYEDDRLAAEEHDNRDDDDYWARRGRGSWRGWSDRGGRGGRGYRGRGDGHMGFRGGRGASFGRGRGGFRKYEPEWKHDKYEEIEQPSSTTNMIIGMMTTTGSDGAVGVAGTTGEDGEAEATGAVEMALWGSEADAEPALAEGAEDLENMNQSGNMTSMKRLNSRLVQPSNNRHLVTIK